MSATNQRLIKKLNDLIELDFDAIDAYRAAVERLESPGYKHQLGEFLGDHLRHTRDLAELVVRLGGTPSQGPDLMRYLTKGKVVIANLIGQDRAILMAMRANEEVTNKRYELALEANAGMDPETWRILKSNLATSAAIASGSSSSSRAKRARRWSRQRVRTSVDATCGAISSSQK